MMLLKQIVVTVAVILPLPLMICNSAGHVGVFFMLLIQVIIAGIVFIVYFLDIAKSSGLSKATAFVRAVVASVLFAFASLFEPNYFGIVGPLPTLLFGEGLSFSASQMIFLLTAATYAALSIACTVSITHLMYRPSQEEIEE